MMQIYRSTLGFVLGLVMMSGLLTGCDSGDPIDDGAGSSSPVAGTYNFEVFFVEPTASSIQPLDMLDTLVLADTRLQLFDGGDFVLSYRYRNGPASAILGRYTHSTREVRLRGDATSSDRRNLRSVLMPDQLVLQRAQDGTGVLSTTFRRTIDLARLSDFYAEIPPVGATVRLQLREQ